MNLLTTNERGWATFYHEGRLTTATLFTTVEVTPVDLNASSLQYFCQLVANLNHKSQKKDAPLQITNIDTTKETFTFKWRKSQEWTFNTIAFLTQAAPELISIYRQSVEELAGEWRNHKSRQ